MPTRRGLILGAVFSLITAPAIVRAASIMPVKPFGVLEALGVDTVDIASVEGYVAQYRAFQKAFLVGYQKERDPVKARDFDVNKFATKWTGTEIERQNANGRAAADDGPWTAEAIRTDARVWNGPLTVEGILQRASLKAV